MAPKLHPVYVLSIVAAFSSLVLLMALAAACAPAATPTPTRAPATPTATPSPTPAEASTPVFEIIRPPGQGGTPTATSRPTPTATPRATATPTRATATPVASPTPTRTAAAATPSPTVTRTPTPTTAAEALPDLVIVDIQILRSNKKATGAKCSDRGATTPEEVAGDGLVDYHKYEYFGIRYSIKNIGKGKVPKPAVSVGTAAKMDGKIVKDDIYAYFPEDDRSLDPGDTITWNLNTLSFSSAGPGQHTLSLKANWQRADIPREIVESNYDNNEKSLGFTYVSCD